MTQGGGLVVSIAMMIWLIVMMRWCINNGASCLAGVVAVKVMSGTSLSATRPILTNVVTSVVCVSCKQSENAKRDGEEKESVGHGFVFRIHVIWAQIKAGNAKTSRKFSGNCSKLKISKAKCN
jgi:hypothetical protein